VRVYRLELHRFRGFDATTIVPVNHVLLSGEPGAGRSNIIEALDRVLSPESTRGRLPTEFDFYRRDTSQRAEVEVVLGALGNELEQFFFDHIEVWDQETGRLVEQTSDPETIDRERYDLVVRLCYRARWNANEEQGEHWVDYAKTAESEADTFERLGRAERERLPFASVDARSKPLEIGSRGEFRRLVEGTAGDDFSKALDDLEQEVERLAGGFSGTMQVSTALERLVAPIRTILKVGNVSAVDILRFLPEGGSISGLLRSLAPAVDLQDGVGRFPLSRHGSTVTAVLSVAQAIARAGEGGIVAVDDFGEGLDAAAAQHLAATLRLSAGQIWLSTRRSQAAEVFPQNELVRLTVEKAGARRVHYGRAPKTKGELLAARHWHLQLLPAMASRSVVGIEGPHDRAALTALANRLHEQEGVELPAARRVTFVDAAAADSSGGATAIPRLMGAARELGFRTVAILDYDRDDAAAKAVLEENLKSADAVVRLPKGCAIELALLQGLDDAVIRETLNELQAAFGLQLPANLDTLAGTKLHIAARAVIKHTPGYHAQFIDGLPPRTHPPLARTLLQAAIVTATTDVTGLVQM
jgi:putative ATP-dependent endonuclease of the OLD family